VNPLWIVIGLGVLGALVYSSLTSASPAPSPPSPPIVSGPFLVQGGVKFWAPGEIPKLAALLSASTVVPNEKGTDRVWDFAPNGTPGGVNALVKVRQIQAQGHAATTTTNLYNTTEFRLMGDALPGEVAGIAGQDVAVLPKM
jgi:hypothetical protein